MKAESKPGAWELRLFAGSWAVIFAWAAWLARSFFPETSLWILPAGTALALAGGLAFPAAMRRPYLLVGQLLAPVGKVFSLVLLAIVFFAVFTPFALILRMFGWNPLRLRRTRPEESGWVERPRGNAASDYNWQY